MKKNLKENMSIRVNPSVLPEKYLSKRSERGWGTANSVVACARPRLQSISQYTHRYTCACTLDTKKKKYIISDYIKCYYREPVHERFIVTKELLRFKISGVRAEKMVQHLRALAAFAEVCEFDTHNSCVATRSCL